MFKQTTTVKADTIQKYIRYNFAAIDMAVYSLMSIAYQILFNVASANIISRNLIIDLFGRIQIILGIVVLFKLAISLLKVVIEPDSLGATKEGSGFGQIIKRILISVVMLAMIIPINIPNPKTDYEKEIYTHGILFGTMYQFQNIVLNQNVLGKLIIGSTYTETTSMNTELESIGNRMATTVLKGFVRVNLKEGATDDTNTDNYMCGTEKAGVINAYNNIDVSPQTILENISSSCKADVTGGSKKVFTFTYMIIISSIVGLIFAVILLATTIDIAIRALKLIVLRVIAPIPIISYIDPKQAQNGAFASWVKALVATYLDLFIRLAIMYFVVFVIQSIMVDGIAIENISGPIGIISIIIIMLGLLFFAQQFPNFLAKVLGLKNLGGNIGLSGLLGGVGGLIGGGGVSGAALGMLEGATSANEAISQGKNVPITGAYTQIRDKMAKIRTGDKDARGGVVGGLMDRMLYNTRERQLARWGLTDDNVGAAKKAYLEQKSLVENLADEKQGAYDNWNQLRNAQPNFVQGPDRNEFGKRNASGKFEFNSKEAQARYNSLKTATDNKNADIQRHHEEAIAAACARYNELNQQYAAESVTLAKQESNYKDGKDARGAMGTLPRLTDQYGNYNAYRAGGDRQPYNPDIRNTDRDSAGGIENVNDRLGHNIGD